MRKTSLKIQMLAGNSFITRLDSDSQKKLTLVFTASLFYQRLVLRLFSSSFFLTCQKMQANPDHSFLLPYRISDVEVFEYQVAGFRSEFIRPSYYGNLGFLYKSDTVCC